MAPLSGSPQTLLGYLATARAEVFTQAEVLCTLSLAWLLQRSEHASSAFARLLGMDRVGVWHAEDRSSGASGRPDLVGRDDAEGPATVIVEAKLSAPLDRGQLEAYQQVEDCRLAVLVPQARVAADSRRLGQWGLDLRVVSWDDGLEDIAAALDGDAAASADLSQLADLYRQVERTWIAPFTKMDLRKPFARVEDLTKLINQVVTLLASRNGFLSEPLFRGRGLDPRRYVFINQAPHSAIGVGAFLSIADELGSPVGLSIHPDTARGGELAERWASAGRSVLRLKGWAYLPLELPVDTAHGDLVESCYAQANALIGLLLDSPLPPAPI